MNSIDHLLAAIYGPAIGAATAPRLEAILAAFATRHPPAPPRSPDDQLTQDDVVLITYGDQVVEPGRPPLQTLADVLTTTFSDTVNTVHILPFYPYTSDDGFSVVDYTVVDPALGDWNDIARLGTQYRLMFDGVVNHISASSAWFRGFLAGEPGAERRFHSIDPATDLRSVTRPRTTPLLTPFETPSGMHHIWTTFSADQIDLNYANPDLLLEMTAVLLEYVARGAWLIRLDAIGYLWKEPGTRCIHLPQVHQVVQLWRAALDKVAPNVLLITETNVPHADNISYFGDGTNEAQLVYQFPLAPLVLHAFATGDAGPLIGWARDLAPPSTRTAFFNFLASHDGIGVVPATGILSVEQVQALCAQVERHGGRVSYKTNPDGSQSPYELNCTWFDALTDPASAEPLALQVARFTASYAIMLALQGVPGIYVHSLVGSPNDHAGFARTGHNRTLNRGRWERSALDALVADPQQRAGAVLRRMRALLSARRREPAFHPNSPQHILDYGPGVFALERRPAAGPPLTCLHNVRAAAQELTLALEPQCSYVNIITGERHRSSENGALTLTIAPYGVVWLARTDSTAASVHAEPAMLTLPSSGKRP
jgi:glucosylglycerate phosphorylase